MPSAAVLSPPITSLMSLGARLEKSLAGDTTLAAIFVVNWAMSTMTAPRMTKRGLPMRAMSTTGSQIASPKTTVVALVTATPMKANAVIVAGRTIGDIRGFPPLTEGRLYDPGPLTAPPKAM
jgi:hypothetical protein